MAKRKRSKTPPTNAHAGAAFWAWNIGTNFETVQIMPSVGYWATYKNGERHPVVAWAIQSRLLREDERNDLEDDEVPPSFINRVVGLVMLGKDAALINADDDTLADGEFDGYEWDL